MYTVEFKDPLWVRKCNRHLSLIMMMLFVFATAYCYLLARAEGKPASLGLSLIWGSTDWGIWLFLLPSLILQICRNSALSLTNAKLLGLALQATLWMPFAALTLRCVVEVLLTEITVLQTLVLAYKRAPVYLVTWLLMLLYVLWQKHQVQDNPLTTPPDLSVKQSSEVQTLVVHSSRGEHVFRLEDIQYLKACGNYLEVKVQDSIYLVRATMKALEEAFAGSALVRCHRSFFVNLNYVLSIEYATTGNHDIMLSTGEKIPVSKGFRDKFRTKFHQSGGAVRSS